MFPMTVTINTMTEFEALMAALGVGKQDKPKAEKPAKGEKPTPTAAKAADQAPVSDNNSVSSTPVPPVSSPAEAAAPAEKPAPEAVAAAPVAESVTYETAAKAVTSLAQKKGRDAAVAILARFDAKKLPDVKPAQYAELMAACTEALGA